MNGRLGKRISADAAIALTLALAVNLLAYYGSRAIAINWYHYDVAISLDGKIPLIPWTVAIYFGCYLFWAVNYCLCAVQEETARNRFFCADALGKLLCFAVFLLFPTTTTRPIIDTSGFWGFLMGLLYQVDSPDNLFPSIHCLVSWFCWIGVRKQKNIPAVYRWGSLAAAVAVCVSVLTTKQHVIVDVIGGVALAEVCYWIAGCAKVSDIYAVAVSKLKKVFRK